MGQQAQKYAEEQKRKQNPAEMARQQEELENQLAEQQELLDQMERNYQAQVEAARAGLTGEYGPIAEAAHQNADGSWSRPLYQTLLDPDTGLLKDNFQLQNTLNTEGLDRYREEALRDPGSQSAWLKMALEGEDLDRLTNQNNLAAQMNAGQRSAMDQLAASGGLDSGSRLSLVRSGLRDMMRGKQDINSASRKNALGLQTTDEENRLKMLQALPGMELQKSQYDADLNQKNIEAAMNERRYAFDNEMDAWNKNQEVWGANKQAEAQRHASSGCFSPEMTVDMADGTKKAIKDIEIGEETLLGGEVLQTLKGKPLSGDDWYLIHGVCVSGSHLLLQGGEWVQARNYFKKERVMPPQVYFNLTTKNHILLIGDVLFSDLQDVDDYTLTDLESLKAKNEAWQGRAS